MKTNKKKFVLLGPIIFVACCTLLPASIFTTFEARAAVGTVFWMAFWWVTGAVDYAVTAFLPIAVNAIFVIADMGVIISNYASETILLLLGASIITVSWEESGLDKRIAAKFLGTVGSNLRKQLIFWFLLSAALSTILPNSVVCATITPIAISMLNYAGEGDIPNSKIGSKLLLNIAYAAGVGGLASPLGGAMNLVTIDYLQQITGQEYIYTSWVIRFFPIMVILVISNILFMLRNVKKDETIGGTKSFFQSQYAKMPRMKIEEKLSLMMFLTATTLAFTRQLYQDLLPGLKPAYAFIICAIFTFLISKVDGDSLLKWKTVQTKIGWEMIYIFAGGLAAGTLINTTGAASDIGKAVSTLGLQAGIGLIIVLISFTLIMSDFTSNTATAAVAIPIVISIVQGMNLNPIPYIYISSIGVNLSYMLPTSIRAIPVGYGLSPKYMLKEGWKMTVLVIVLMSIVSYFMLTYWPAFSTI